MTEPVKWVEKSKKELEARQRIFPVFNQRNIPACVAHSVVYMMQQHWYAKTGKVINFSLKPFRIIGSNIKHLLVSNKK